MGFITVVRDLESGTVLHTGKGKGYKALAKFRKRINPSSKIHVRNLVI